MWSLNYLCRCSERRKVHSLSWFLLDYVHAFWEGGAAAFGRADEWSDIDAYLLVNDSKVADAFLAVEKALESVSPIKQNTL